VDEAFFSHGLLLSRKSSPPFPVPSIPSLCVWGEQEEGIYLRWKLCRTQQEMLLSVVPRFSMASHVRLLPRRRSKVEERNTVLGRQNNLVGADRCGRTRQSRPGFFYRRAVGERMVSESEHVPSFTAPWCQHQLGTGPAGQIRWISLFQAE
jgi:hypothetical protein